MKKYRKLLALGLAMMLAVMPAMTAFAETEGVTEQQEVEEPEEKAPETENEAPELKEAEPEAGSEEAEEPEAEAPEKEKEEAEAEAEGKTSEEASEEIKEEPEEETSAEGKEESEEETSAEGKEESEEEAAEAPEEKEEETEETSAEEKKDAGEKPVPENIVLTAELDDVTVTLKADADAFDNKGELSLKVTPAEITGSEEKALEAAEKENVAKRVTYDITVLDDGEEIEPVKAVKVSFELKDAPSGADGVNIYHHETADSVEQIFTENFKEDAAEETDAAEEDEDDVTAEAETDSFSLYTVDFTYEDKTVSISGDSTGNKLDDIVDQLGIEEKVEEATAYQDAECTEEAEDGEVKDGEKTLFSVYESGNEWYVDAVNAFQTEHGLVVKTADGAEYKIKVTDAGGETAELHFLNWDDTQNKLVDAFIGTGTGTKAATYTIINSANMPTALAEGWYVVDGTVDYTAGGTVTKGITVTGAVHLILKDGCTLTVTGAEDNAGICVTNTDPKNPNNTLTIYAGNTSSDISGSGTLTAKGGTYGAGIGGGNGVSGSNITINGGKVIATGGAQASGIGGGRNGGGSDITINGGEVAATGEQEGAGIGGGAGGSDITINGGTVEAQGGSDGGAGIGGGYKGSGSKITITGGTVKANGGSGCGGGAGIGGGSGNSGSGGSGSVITISGGIVTATGDGNGAGIGGGGGSSSKDESSGGSGSVITISGGIVTATGCGNGAGIGGGGGSNVGSGSNIKAATSVVVKAGDSANPTFVISHTYEDDLTSNDNFNGKQYVTAVIEYTVTYNANGATGGTVPTDAKKYTYNASVTVLENTGSLVKTSYTFAGWNTKADGTGTDYAAGSTLNITADTTLYAQWDMTPVSYIDADGSTKTCNSYTPVSNSDFTWGDDGNEGWYVVDSSIEVTQGYTVSGNVKLILLDGCSLTVTGASEKAGICVSGDGNSLTIYAGNTAQTIAGTGALDATGGGGGAGIGGGLFGSGSNITINGGTVDANGTTGGAGIGGGAMGAGSNITINGGTVDANGTTGETCGTGIGGGASGAGSNITINGGKVTATGGNGAAGIGGGSGGSGSKITINGGEVNANGGQSAAGIGGGVGYECSGSYITINGGEVTATGGGAGTYDVGAGIGNGGSGTTPASNIKAAASVAVKAGDSADPTTVITHDKDTDLSTVSDFKGKQYVTAETLPTYTVTFDVQGHGTAPAEKKVMSGGKVTKPDDPTAEGYAFGGWYKETGCTTAWDFEAGTVTADTTLYAKWTKNSTPTPTPDDPSSDPVTSQTEEPKPSFTGTQNNGAAGTTENPVTGGQWNCGPGGQWTFRTNGQFKDTWGYIKLDNGKVGWFYFDKNGIMATGWQQVNGKWYYFNTNHDGSYGMMLTDTTTPDGYRVGPDGVWIQ